ncbi:hypothetical protein M569_10580 [Genlisea aurea]|uniref:Uncharacterized protein n=1 Tax=Genlisea aurea TaxID=192259 RepID=S8CHV5_9LAMI|nr:hypothetical protein M569_10580 [Genlisea aurea]
MAVRQKVPRVDASPICVHEAALQRVGGDVEVSEMDACGRAKINRETELDPKPQIRCLVGGRFVDNRSGGNRLAHGELTRHHEKSQSVKNLPMERITRPGLLLRRHCRTARTQS